MILIYRCWFMIRNRGSCAFRAQLCKYDKSLQQLYFLHLHYWKNSWNYFSFATPNFVATWIPTQQIIMTTPRPNKSHICQLIYEALHFVIHACLEIKRKDRNLMTCKPWFVRRAFILASPELSVCLYSCKRKCLKHGGTVRWLIQIKKQKQEQVFCKHSHEVGE